MFCPNCNTQNHATDVRCMHCGTTLIFETEGHSANYKRGAMMVDRRIYTCIGSFLGFGLALLLLNTVLENFYFDSMEKWIICASGIATGFIGGRITTSMKWHDM